MTESLEPSLAEDYRVLEQVGVGPDGVTYHAVRDADGTQVELRLLHTGGPTPVSDVLVRLRLAALLKHPAAQRVLAIQSESPVSCVLEPTAGKTLDVGWSDLPLQNRLENVCEVAEVIEQAHRLGLAHGELNTHSIRAREDHSVQVDFTGRRTGGGEQTQFDANDTTRSELSSSPSAARIRDLQQLAQLIVSACSASTVDAALFPLGPWREGLQGLDESATRPEVQSLIDWMQAVADDETSTTTHASDVVPLLRAIVEKSSLHGSAPLLPKRHVSVDLENDTPWATPGTSAPVSHAREVPKQLGRYRIGEQIGAGGMGAVYRAEDLGSGEAVAVKVLSPATFHDASARRRFLKEGRLMAEIRSPHVARLLEQSEDQGWLYLAMELIDGVALKEYILWQAPLSEKRALQLTADIARGLVGAHQLDIIHRDIKPGNVLLSGAV